ncbi:MAG: hypothetical protein RLY93_07170 [Sumerlaeia bacterium]
MTMRLGFLFPAAVTTAALISSQADAVEFRLSEEAAPGAAQVYLAGSFNGWTSNSLPLNTDANGDWFAFVPLADGQYAYKFVIEAGGGEVYWTPDPANNAYAPSEAGFYDSLVAVADDATTVPAGGVEVFEWRGEVESFAGVIGDFNGWTVGGFPMLQEGDGVWRARIALQRPLTYKFFIDDIWKPDPAAENFPDGFGSLNSIREADLMVAGDPEDWTAEGDQSSGFAALSTKSKLSPEEGRKEAQKLADKGKYGKAVRTLRQSVRKGSITDQRAALTLEAEIHKRFGKSNRAAKCWEQILALPADKTTGRTGFDTGEGSADVDQIIHDLAKYRLFMEDDGAAARLLYDQLLQAAGDDRQVASIL